MDPSLRKIFFAQSKLFLYRSWPTTVLRWFCILKYALVSYTDIILHICHTESIEECSVEHVAGQGDGTTKHTFTKELGQTRFP
jgi:hypothetical protein